MWCYLHAGPQSTSQRKAAGRGWGGAGSGEGHGGTPQGQTDSGGLHGHPSRLFVHLGDQSVEFVSGENGE